MPQRNQETIPIVETLIRVVRGEKVLLDSDLAALYGVSTSRFNEAVKRNLGRFPSDFRFQLTVDEVKVLTSQIAISKAGSGGRRYRPFAFTEHGAIMAANVLRSKRAIDMSIYVVRAFVQLRSELARNLDYAKRLAEIEKMLTSHDVALRELYNKIRPLLLPPPQQKREIGFHAKPGSGSQTTNKRKALL